MVGAARRLANGFSPTDEPSGLGSFELAEPVVSVVIPTLNEEDGIVSALSELPVARLKESGFASEVVVVDGNSSDETAERAEKFGARVVVQNRLGYGLAYKTGFDASRGEFLVALDGDHSYPASLVPKLVEIMIERDLDFVTTDRLAGLEPEAMDRIHRFGNWMLTTAVRLLFSIRISDSQSGMWAIRKSALQKILPKSNGMAFSQEIKIRAFKSCKCLEIPIRYRKRIGNPKIQLVLDGFKNLSHLVRLRFLLR